MVAEPYGMSGSLPCRGRCAARGQKCTPGLLGPTTQGAVSGAIPRSAAIREARPAAISARDRAYQSRNDYVAEVESLAWRRPQRRMNPGMSGSGPSQRSNSSVANSPNQLMKWPPRARSTPTAARICFSPLGRTESTTRPWRAAAS